jgi:hypothetical protein
MVNSYAREIVVPRITAQEAQRRFRQGEFLRRNHHLISPWMYTPQQVEARNRALFLMNFDIGRARMKPLADGEIVVDERHGAGTHALVAAP